MAGQSSLLWDITEAQNALLPPVYFSHVSAWHGHIPFAFFITQVSRPRVFVELGVHMGDSYMSFLRGMVATGQLGKAYGVDTWEGDAHSGKYSENVYPSLKSVHDPLYGEFSSLLRETFDDAAKRFETGEMIDLLHIDGCHTYEAVSHDLETWLPLLSDRGIVLMHDTNVAEFGVWRKWRELTRVYPCFEFLYSNGLGMALVGKNQPEMLLEMAEKTETLEGDWIRDYFEMLGRRVNMHREARNGKAN